MRTETTLGPQELERVLADAPRCNLCGQTIDTVDRCECCGREINPAASVGGDALEVLRVLAAIHQTDPIQARILLYGISWPEASGAQIGHEVGLTAARVCQKRTDLLKKLPALKSFLGFTKPESIAHARRKKCGLTSSHPGVHYIRARKAWVAQGSDRRHVGYYPTEELAVAAKESYERSLNKQEADLGLKIDREPEREDLQMYLFVPAA